MISRIRHPGRPAADIDHGPGPAPHMSRNGGLPIGHMEAPDVKGASWRQWDAPQPRRQPMVARREDRT